MYRHSREGAGEQGILFVVMREENARQSHQQGEQGLQKSRAQGRSEDSGMPGLGRTTLKTEMTGVAGLSPGG